MSALTDSALGFTVESEPPSVLGRVFDESPGLDCLLDDSRQPDHRESAFLFIWKPEVRASRMAEHSDQAGVLSDPVSIDDVGAEGLGVAAPGGEVGVASDEGSLIEHLELVIVGDQPAEALDVTSIYAVDEGEDEADGFRGHNMRVGSDNLEHWGRLKGFRP